MRRRRVPLDDAVADAFRDAYPWGLSDAEVANVTVSEEFLRVHGPDALRQLVEEQASYGHGWSTLAAALGRESME